MHANRSYYRRNALQSDFEFKVLRRAAHPHASEGPPSSQSRPVRKVATASLSSLMEKARKTIPHQKCFPTLLSFLHFVPQISASL